jgi:hypothetical protein
MRWISSAADAAPSKELAAEGLVNVAVGAEELQVAKGARKVARELEQEGVKETADLGGGKGAVIGGVVGIG